MNAGLEQIYSQIPSSSCPPGCGACCGILFPSLAELRNIKQWCQQHNKPYRDFMDTTGLDCPYLTSEKECFIYRVRPFLCRITGVSADLPCPLHKLTAVRLLNHSQSSALYTAVYLKGKEKPRTEKHKRLLKPILQAIEDTEKKALYKYGKEIQEI